MTIPISLLFCWLGAATPQAAVAPAVVPSKDEVVFDFVVRDKRGRPVKDLAAGDVEISDGGNHPKLSSLRLIDGTEAVVNGSRSPLDPLQQVRLVTLVFEQLSPDSRRQAKSAATEFLKAVTASNVRVGVVGINRQLILLQPFTADRDAVRKAIELAVGGNEMVRQVPESTRMKQELRRMAISEGDAVSKRLAQTMLEMTRYEDALQADEGTRSSIFSLLSLIRGQAGYPGRKSIVYFSEGMWVPTHLDEPLRAVPSTANFANVAIYAIDTRGVMTGRQNEGIMQAMSDVSKDTAADITAQESKVSTAQILASDRVEAGMRNNVQLPLRNLAESTGAFLVADTNDFAKPMRQLNEDLGTYYEAVYNPGIENFDGSLRKTDVKVARSDTRVLHGTGYFALPAEARLSGLLPFEAVLMKLLASAPLPRDVQFRSAAVRLHPTANGVEGAALIEVPMSGLQFTHDEANKQYSARVSIMAVIRNMQGEVVKKFSRDLPLKGPWETSDRVKQGNFIYKEPFTLPPGRYTFESGALDREANKAGARKASFVVPVRSGTLAISNLTLVRSYQPKAPNLDPADPFQFQGGRITPTLNPTVVAAKGAMLSLFFVVYPDPAIAEKPQVILEYTRDGQVAGRGSIELPAADSMGRIPYVMSSPAENMPPGNYEVRAIVKQGTAATEERAFFTIEAPAAAGGSH